MKPIIKYRGGKSKEICNFIQFVPKEFDRYVEPSIEIQPFSDYVKSNCKENTHVHAKGRDHWHGSGDV